MMMKNIRGRMISLAIRIQMVGVCALLLAGCFPGAKAPLMVDHYTLEYASPAFGNIKAVSEAIRVERFAVAQAYNTTSMLYKPAPYKLEAYGSARWRVGPGDILSDYLVRDIRSAGIFRGAFSYREGESARFVLEGGVEEFLEVDEKNKGTALLIVRIALIDSKETESTKRLVFQKSYRFAEPLAEQSAKSLAEGMSVAVQRLSEQALKDVLESVQRLNAT